MKSNSCLGKVVYSKAGRDSNRFFIIVGILDSNYVYICDGDLRLIENPKKKKIKHLTFTNSTAEDIKDLLLSGKKISNAMIRKFLQSYDNNKEV
ncbi:KOW domain-containing RNA-binding protein [Clostridium fermenticellae]|uniref:KOW domain-containing RNA-binding protein n=1 Tax=Clostridium fermenticellae TaxID=2068654 RepID=UPI0013C4BB31|nr:KOW domain-containing RNA-binding protein [Clostridium fermenticellae]